MFGLGLEGRERDGGGGRDGLAGKEDEEKTEKLKVAGGGYKEKEQGGPSTLTTTAATTTTTSESPVSSDDEWDESLLEPLRCVRSCRASSHLSVPLHIHSPPYSPFIILPPSLPFSDPSLPHSLPLSLHHSDITLSGISQIDTPSKADPFPSDLFSGGFDQHLEQKRASLQARYKSLVCDGEDDGGGKWQGSEQPSSGGWRRGGRGTGRKFGHRFDSGGRGRGGQGRGEGGEWGAGTRRKGNFRGRGQPR